MTVPLFIAVPERSWMDQAVCAGERNFTEWPILAQQSLCRVCPVRTQCVDYAVKGPLVVSPETDTVVYGGMHPRELHKMQTQVRKALIA